MRVCKDTPPHPHRKARAQGKSRPRVGSRTRGGRSSCLCTFGSVCSPVSRAVGVCFVLVSQSQALGVFLGGVYMSVSVFLCPEFYVCVHVSPCVYPLQHRPPHLLLAGAPPGPQGPLRMLGHHRTGHCPVVWAGGTPLVSGGLCLRHGLEEGSSHTGARAESCPAPRREHVPPTAVPSSHTQPRPHPGLEPCRWVAGQGVSTHW